jgi:hypothetical protein
MRTPLHCHLGANRSQENRHDEPRSDDAAWMHGPVFSDIATQMWQLEDGPILQPRFWGGCPMHQRSQPGTIEEGRGGGGLARAWVASDSTMPSPVVGWVGWALHGTVGGQPSARSEEAPVKLDVNGG